MSLEAKVMIAFAAFMAVFYGTPVLYFKFGWFKKFYHDVMHWHQPSGKQSFDGCSFQSECRHCGRKILQDSQGNWFSLE